MCTSHEYGQYGRDSGCGVIRPIYDVFVYVMYCISSPCSSICCEFPLICFFHFSPSFVLTFASTFLHTKDDPYMYLVFRNLATYGLADEIKNHRSTLPRCNVDARPKPPGSKVVRKFARAEGLPNVALTLFTHFHITEH